MNSAFHSGEPNRSKGGKTLRVILGVTGGVAVLTVVGCGLIGFLIYRGVSQTVQQVKQDFAADQAVHRATVDENRRRDLIQSAKAGAQAYKEKYEFCRDQHLARERLLAKSPFPDFKGNPTSGFLRAVGENPESFAKEFQIKDEYLPKLEAVKTLDECQRLAVELEAKVLEIRRQRYRPELDSLRDSVAVEFDKVKVDAYCVVQMVPPISEFAKVAYGAALTFDLVSGMWMFSAATLGETPSLPFSKFILENAGQPRVTVIRTRERAVEYIVQSVFAENHFDGASPAACPWRLIATSPDKATAQAVAEQAATTLRAERRPDREAGKSADPRPV